MVVLSILSRSLVPFNILEPMQGVYDWKKFETFDARFDALKVSFNVY